jgi:hypothetical protein
MFTNNDKNNVKFIGTYVTATSVVNVGIGKNLNFVG